MTRIELEAEAAQYCSLEGWTDVASPPDWTKLVAEGLRLFSWEAEYMRGITANLSTVANVAEYAIPNTPPDWKLIEGAVYTPAAVGSKARELRITDAVRLLHDDPLYYTRVAGSPQMIWLTKPDTLRLHSMPNTTGDTVTIIGVTCDAEMAAPVNSPSCPSHFHRGVALWAAWLWADKYATGEARQRAMGWLFEAKDLATACRQYIGSQDTPAFQRRVARRSPEYVNLGGWLPPRVGK